MSPALDMVGIIVGDLAKALDFYRRLGLDFPDGEGHVETTSGGMRVALDSEEVIRSFDPGWDPGGRGRVGLAFLCDSPAELDRLHAELKAAGYESPLEPFDAPWGQRYAQIADPDGNALDLFAPLG
jgi:catechol 2,3-dioxygenase-like lactoylglutathione lyase family enzyme